jgi:serine/threonine protein kinase
LIDLKFEKDFGMSRVLQQDIEGKTKSDFGPIRWMSPESIGQQVYSKKSDVWMFGIVVWGPVWHLLVVSLDRSLLGSN